MRTAAEVRRVEHIMGTAISLDVPQPGVGDVGYVFTWLHEVDARFSPFRPDSEVSLGLSSPEMIRIRALCREYEERSGGAFRATLPGRSFDPSAIVKGWAVQCAADLLRARGITKFCLNAGGDVVASGRVWSVGIRHPEDAGQICAALAVEDKCVATSGTYERGQHILDGRTGRPPQGLLSLTVVADDLTTADAVSTAAFATGGEEGIAWAHAQPGCEVLAVTADRAVRWSDSLESSLIRS